MDTENQKQKPKPGRPKKRILDTGNVILGVKSEPTNPNHAMELVYNDPKMFKKIFSMYKGYFVDDILIMFKKDTFHMYAKDHTKKTIIKIVIDCTKINEYYCKIPFNIHIKREYLEKIFSTIEKTHNKILFVSNEDSIYSTLEIHIVNNELAVHDTYMIDLSMRCKTDENLYTCECMNNDKNDYLISFTIKAKAFKKFISDTSSHGKILTIEKLGDNNLKFKMCFNNKINFVRTVVNESTYNINSSLDDNDYFNINLELEYIKPFSAMNICDTVNVFIDKNKKAVFENIIGDNLCVVSIYNDIINYVSITQ